jgi:hypothetical protein
VGRGPAAQAAAVASEKRLKRPWARSAGIASIGGYLVAVAVFETTRRAAGFPTPSDIALTPAKLAEGKVWLLLTSALLVSGPPLLELSGLVLATGLLVRRAGPAAFWRAAVAGHVGGTLLTYAGIGLLWLTARSAVAGIVRNSDYGVSSVWLGVIGAVFASTLRKARPWSALDGSVLGICSIAALIGASAFPALSDVEHGLAFVLGAAVQWEWSRRNAA